MVKRKSKKNGKKTIILVSITVLIVLFAVCSYLAYKNILTYYEYGTSIKVGDYVGINLDTDKINFGTTFPGGHSKREIFVNTTTPGYVFITVTGPMNNMIKTFDQFSYVEKGEQKSFVLYAAPPEDFETGVYNSTVHIYILKTECKLFRLFLKGRPIEVMGLGAPVPNQGAQIKLNISGGNQSINASEGLKT